MAIMSLIEDQTRPENRVAVSSPALEVFGRAAGDGLYGMDMDGKFSFINPAAAKMLGFTSEEMQGKDIHELIHHSHADGTEHSKANCPLLLGLRRREEVRIREDVFWRKDGIAIPVEYVASPLI